MANNTNRIIYNITELHCKRWEDLQTEKWHNNEGLTFIEFSEKNLGAEAIITQYYQMVYSHALRKKWELVSEIDYTIESGNKADDR